MSEIKLDKILVELGLIKEDVGVLKEDVGILKEDVKILKKQTAENYKVAQRANILVEDFRSRLEQIAEGTLEIRIFGKKIYDHEERISQLEWKSDMHEKAIKKVVNG